MLCQELITLILKKDYTDFDFLITHLTAGRQGFQKRITQIFILIGIIVSPNLCDQRFLSEVSFLV